MRDLPPMPSVATRIMSLVEDRKTSPEDLAAVVSTDQALTAKLIRLANSAEYAYGRPSGSARDAILLLGFLQVRQVAVTSSLMSMFGGGQAPDDVTFDSDLFWAHSLTVAVAAEMVAKATRKAKEDDAFTAGILHDFGRLVLRQAMPDEFRDAGRMALETGMPLREAEIETMGYSHERVGQALAKKWTFPAHLAAAIGDHHDETLTVHEHGLRGIIAKCNQMVLHEGITCGFYGEHDKNPVLAPDLAELQGLAGGMTVIMSRASWFMDKTMGRPEAPSQKAPRKAFAA